MTGRIHEDRPSGTDPPVRLIQHNNPPPNPVSIDSRIAGTTVPQGWIRYNLGTLSPLGTYTYSFWTVTDDTPCDFEPLNVYGDDIRIHIVACEPRFITDNGNPVRIAPGAVVVYLPPSMSNAQDALEAALTDWRDTLGAAGTSFTFEVVNENSQPPVTQDDCFDRSDCVAVTDTETQYCGRAFGTPGSDGIIGNNAEVRLNSGWTTFSSEGLQRTFVHEFGHLFGLDNYNANECDVSDAAMQDTFACQQSGVMDDVTINDWLPAARSVYDTQPDPMTSCGF